MTTEPPADPIAEAATELFGELIGASLPAKIYGWAVVVRAREAGAAVSIASNVVTHDLKAMLREISERITLPPEQRQ